MKEKYVKLQFNKSLVAVSGYPFGKKTFNEQMSDFKKLTGKVIIGFPETIDQVTSSFWQGFFEHWMETEGKATIIECVRIEPEKFNTQLINETRYWG